MITAELFGVPLETVEVSKVDSHLTPVDPGSFGSRVTSTAGNAVKIAALKARDKLAVVAAEVLGGEKEEVEFKKESVFLKGRPEKAIPFRKLCHLTYTYGHGQVIVGEGHWSQEIDMPNWETGEGDLAGTYTFGTQVAEVEVDRLTGKIKLNKMVVAHDLGYAINPLACEGQHEGSVFGGLGHCIYEECRVEDGKTLNPSFLDYKMPTAMDMPRVMESIGIETMDQEGVFGAKESAEGTQVSTVPAIVNAIYDATGVMFKELPVTPEKVLKALEGNISEGEG
jgi:4-hydroxybenzoyl-CoA reductase subunit alpha